MTIEQALAVLEGQLKAATTLKVAYAGDRERIRAHLEIAHALAEYVQLLQEDRRFETDMVEQIRRIERDLIRGGGVPTSEASKLAS